MAPRLVLAAVCLALACGCSKKPAKPVDSNDDKAPPSKTGNAPEASKPASDRKKGTEKANWLNDPRFKKDEYSKPEAESSGVPGKPGWGIAKPEGGWAPEKPQAGATASGAAPAAPAKPNTPPGTAAPATATTSAAGKPVSEADLKEVWVYVENRSGASGQMPSAKETLDALTAAGSKAADLVRDGSIVLTGARSRESVWAYEKNALTQGGLMVTQTGVERTTAENLASRLGR
jgi:hypothetical protein